MVARNIPGMNHAQKEGELQFGRVGTDQVGCSLQAGSGDAGPTQGTPAPPEGMPALDNSFLSDRDCRASCQLHFSRTTITPRSLPGPPGMSSKNLLGETW